MTLKNNKGLTLLSFGTVWIAELSLRRNYCNVLRDDGMSYLPALRAQTSGDYVEQLTYLLVKYFK